MIRIALYTYSTFSLKRMCKMLTHILSVHLFIFYITTFGYERNKMANIFVVIFFNASFSYLKSIKLLHLNKSMNPLRVETHLC
ncbi:MAG: hypothetical protein EXX96DRAFT_571975 [Benjaminiella poitrasii]|nr:MAG: hypothetical protein EXX96DRAFT_571975 [Benjaminiella poitrasii]